MALHVWTGAPCCHVDMLDEPQKWVSRTVGSALAGSFEPLVKCSSQLAELVLLHYSCGKSTLYSDRLHNSLLPFLDVTSCLCQ